MYDIDIIDLFMRRIHQELKDEGFELENDKRNTTDYIIEEVLNNEKIKKTLMIYMQYEQNYPSLARFGCKHFLKNFVVYYWAIYNDTWEYIDRIPKAILDTYFPLSLYVLDKECKPSLAKDVIIPVLKDNCNIFKRINGSMKCLKDPQDKLKIIRDMLTILTRNPNVCKKEDGKEEYNLLSYETLSVFPVVTEENALISSGKSMLEDMTDTQKEIVSRYDMDEDVLVRIRGLIEQNIEDEKLEKLNSNILGEFEDNQLLLYTKEQIEMLNKVWQACCLSDYRDVKNILLKDSKFFISFDLIKYDLFHVLNIYFFSFRLLGKLSEEGKKEIIEYLKLLDENYKKNSRKIIHTIVKDLKSNNLDPKEFKKK